MLNPKSIGSPGEAMFAVAICVFALLAASYPVLRTIGWWVEGAIEPVLAIVSIGLYAGLIVVAMTTPEPVALAALLVIMVSAVATPILGRVKDKAELQRIEDERFQECAAALERNPMDPVARIALAEALYRRGEVDQAIEQMQWTLQQYPRLSFRIKPQLDGWMRQRDEMRARAALCPACGAESSQGATFCAACGAALAEHAARRQAAGALPRVPGAVLVRGWIVAATVVLAFLATYTWLPGRAAGPISLGLVLAGVWWFCRWTGVRWQAPS